MKRPMAAFPTQLLLAIRLRFTRRARLEVENLILRQQPVVLRRKSATRVKLWNIDRLLLVQVRTHLSLDKNAPDPRCPQKLGRIASIAIPGGLHHQYVRV